MKCIIVDDEPLAREGLTKLLTENPIIEVMGEFSNTDTAAVFISDNDVDLIFLDIEMPGSNGIEFAKRLPEHILIVFTTAYSQYATKSYELDALDYLLKPLTKARVDKAVAKAQQQSELLNTYKAVYESNTGSHLTIKSERKYYRIPFANIIFVEGLKDYVVLYTATEKIITAMNLKSFHSKLPISGFLRVSKSYIVNKEAVESFDRNTIYIGSHEIPIGKTYQAEFQKHFLG